MIVYGKNVIREIIRSNKKIKKVFLANNFNGEDIINYLNENNVEIKSMHINDMNKMESGNHQGIIADIEDYKYLNEKEVLDNLSDNPFIVILDHLEDTHNFGAIIRTCEAAGVDFIVIPKDRSVSVNSTVMKTSCGAVNNVKICMATNINNFIDKLKNKNVWVVGTDMEDSVMYDDIDYNMPIALVIGSEGFGMSALTRKKCDFIARIPMYGKVNSLNASVAAGIMIYEVVRKRK